MTDAQFDRVLLLVQRFLELATLVFVVLNHRKVATLNELHQELRNDLKQTNKKLDDGVGR